MTHLPRRVRAPGTFFVTSNTWERRRLFLKEAPARLFLDTLFHYRTEGNFLLHEFVLMPDHFHLLFTPALDVALERAVQLVKGGSSHRIRKELGYRFPVWQTGFSDHRIRSQEDFEIYKRYIAKNPVHGKLARQTEEYAYCSYYAQFRPVMDAWPPQDSPSAAKANPGETQTFSRAEAQPRQLER